MICRLGVCGNDIDNLITLDENVVNTFCRLNVLTEQSKIVVGANDRIKSVDAVPGVAAGVGGFAEILGCELLAADHSEASNAVGVIVSITRVASFEGVTVTKTSVWNDCPSCEGPGYTHAINETSTPL